MQEATFEASIKELEEIVKKLEGGNCPLTNVKLFERVYPFQENAKNLKRSGKKVNMLVKKMIPWTNRNYRAGRE